MNIVSFFTDVGEGIYDTITGGRGTTKESAEEIEKASQQYKQKMEDIVKAVNTKEEGGEGRADDLIARFEEDRRKEETEHA